MAGRYFDACERMKAIPAENAEDAVKRTLAIIKGGGTEA